MIPGKARSVLRVLFALSLVSASSWITNSWLVAQVLYGSITAHVVDATGGAVPGADVSVVNLATNHTRKTLTNDSGAFTLLNLPTGRYTLTVSLPGFRRYVAHDVIVTAGNVTGEHIVLEVGGITEQLTVYAKTPLQTGQADVNARLDAKEIADLPMTQYRNYQSLLNLVPGATPARGLSSIDRPLRPLETNINGTNRNSNNTRIDGATSMRVWFPQHTAYVPPAETIEEVKVSTNSFDAEQGFAGGAAITVITKKGSNDFHGSLFAHHENYATAARDFFLRGEKPKSLRNILGATIGGPIKKDKLFFFFGWEGMLERRGFTKTLTVATEDQRQGDFSAFRPDENGKCPANPTGRGCTIIYDPLTGIADGSGRTPFLNNVIPSSRMNPAALTMQSLMPLPNLPGVTNNFQNSGTQRFDRYNFDTRLDWYRRDDHVIWGKLGVMDALIQADFEFGPGGGTGLSTGGAGDSDTTVRVSGIGHTWTLSPTFLLDANVGYTDMHQEVVGPDIELGNFGQDVLGIPGTNKTDEQSCPDNRCSGMPRFSVSGFAPFGNANTWGPLFRDERSFTFTQNFSWSHGDHEFRWGYDTVKHMLDHWQPDIGGGPRGRFQFNRSMTTVKGFNGTDQNAYAAYLLGLPWRMEKSLQWELMTTREWQHAFYFRDRWQLSPRLTLTLGLRYEYFPLVRRADRPMERLDFDTLQVHLSNDIEVGKSDFAPRIGLAWRLGANHVIRTGYGITNSPIPYGRPLRGFYPLTIAATFDADHPRDPFRTLEAGIPLFSGPDLSGDVLYLPPEVDMRSMPADRTNRGYIQSWNLVYERKLPSEFVVSAGYVGTQTVHQMADHDINWSPPGGGNSGRQLFAEFGRTARTRYWDGWLSSNYHALQVTINRRFVDGLFVKGAYTYSHAINMTDDEGWAGLLWNDPSILARNRARAGYDIPHILQLAALYELPFKGGGHRWLNALTRGWQINSIFSVNDQRPFTLQAPSLGAFGNLPTPDQVTPTVRKLGGIGPENPYYDTAAFQAPTCSPDCRYGTVGRNTLRGPTWINWDFSVFRRFQLSDDLDLEFRAEAFNFTNTPKFDNPTRAARNVNSSSFLQITQTSRDSNPRLWRFGLKLLF